jgi:hypothetical protein
MAETASQTGPQPYEYAKGKVSGRLQIVVQASKYVGVFCLHFRSKLNTLRVLSVPADTNM